MPISINVRYNQILGVTIEQTVDYKNLILAIQKYCTNIPADIKIKKCSKDNPYIALILRFTLEEIYEVIKETKDRMTKNSKTIQTPLCT